MSVEEDVQKLRDELDSLKNAFSTLKGNHFTPDGYLRYESLPQLVGGVTHFAGSEEVVAERWEYVSPVTGAGGAASTIDLTADGTTSVLSATETGKLLAIGIYCSGSDYAAWGVPNAVCKLLISIDGGTAEELLITNGYPTWLSQNLPFASGLDRNVSVSPYWGWGAFRDAMMLPFNFEYSSSISVSVEVSSTSGWAGSDTYSIGVNVHRARLVTT